MNDLRDHFEEIAGPMHAVDSKQVEADLTRGRRALRRRRTVQAVAGSAFGVAALAAALAVATSSTEAPSERVTAGAPAVQLVAYQGEQPKGFTVDKVPDGWYIQASEQGYLTVAPKGASTDDSFVGKIGIMLESKDQNGPGREGKTVKVGGAEGLLVESLSEPDASGDRGSSLWIKQPSGVYLIVQVWQGLGLTEAQIVELAAGVHVHKDAVQGVG
ncbi:MAG: hypothetical protein SYR96_31600 [Actinomycetota bacterium]|nr:hypothetical protein [Actinomycetota bacterium]